MITTTISKLPIHPLLNPHNTQVPSCEFEIEFAGFGSNIFALTIDVSHPFMTSGRYKTGATMQLVTCEGIPQRIASGVQEWIQVTNFEDHEGIDYFELSECEVRTAQGDLLASSLVPGQGMHECIPHQAFAGRSNMVLAKVLHDAHVLYHVKSNNPFDPKLMLIQHDDVPGSKYVKHFMYDEKIVKPSVDYHDVCNHTVKFLFK